MSLLISEGRASLFLQYLILLNTKGRAVKFLWKKVYLALHIFQSTEGITLQNMALLKTVFPKHCNDNQSFTGALRNSLLKKCPKVEFFSVSYFPLFGLRIEIYVLSLYIQSSYGKIGTRLNSAFRQLFRSDSEVNQGQHQTWLTFLAKIVNGF